MATVKHGAPRAHQSRMMISIVAGICAVALIVGVATLWAYHERTIPADTVQAVPVESVAGGPAVSSGLDESHDLPALDEETAYRIDTSRDLPAVDEETRYRVVTPASPLVPPDCTTHRVPTDLRC